ncbi:MAG TPA: hypothetical protein VGN51_03785 [Acidimicrobiia bacterium]|jgi:hypothetical protein
MSAWQELADTGRLGNESSALIYATVRAVGRSFPPPEGYRTWTGDAVIEAAHDFVAEAPKRVLDAWLGAVDERSFEVRMQGAVRNWFRDRGRRTRLGRLVRRIREVLDDDNDFARTGNAATRDERWHLTGGPAAPTTATEHELLLAAATEKDVAIPRWHAKAKRQAPDADRDTIVRLARRILEAADGSVAGSDLARAMGHRLGVAPQPQSLELDEHDESDLADPTAEQAVEHSVARMTAHDIFERLTLRERLVVATWTESVRNSGAALGLGHSQAATLRERVVAMVRSELIDDDMAEVVLDELTTKAAEWWPSRTRDDNPPFQ